MPTKRAANRKRHKSPKRRRSGLTPDLETKLRPTQKRSHSTYDAILEAAGELLAEVGVERLSTNLVCKRAGLTPPALYRYFPNKYALLKELGARLMLVQDEAVFEWQDRMARRKISTVEESAARRSAILNKINVITRRFPGGGWVMRSLRALPMLSAVRIESRETVAERDFQMLAERHPTADKKALRVATTLSVEVMYAAMEMIADQPELDAALISQEISYMTALYLDSFKNPRRKIHLPIE